MVEEEGEEEHEAGEEVVVCLWVVNIVRVGRWLGKRRREKGEEGEEGGKERWRLDAGWLEERKERSIWARHSREREGKARVPGSLE